MEYADLALAQVLCYDAFHGSRHAQRLIPALGYPEDFRCLCHLPWLLHWILSFLQRAFLARSGLEAYGWDSFRGQCFETNARVAPKTDVCGRSPAFVAISDDRFFCSFVGQLPQLLEEHLRVWPCHFNHDDCPGACPSQGPQGKERDTSRSKVNRTGRAINRIIHRNSSYDGGNAEATRAIDQDDLIL